MADVDVALGSFVCWKLCPAEIFISWFLMWNKRGLIIQCSANGVSADFLFDFPLICLLVWVCHGILKVKRRGSDLD